MANDNRKNPDNADPREHKEPGPESFPGNPNKQKQDSPRQQHGESDAKGESSRLQKDRSVTDRTVRRTVLGTHDVDPEDNDIDRLKG